MAAIDDEFEGMLEDCDAAFADTCTILITTYGAFNVAAGTRTPTTSNVSVSATRQPERLEPGSGGKPNVRSIEFRVKTSAMAGATVRAGDTLLDTDDETVWLIWGTEYEVNGLEVVLKCRNVEKSPVPVV